jgi:hypothetical protein
MMRTSCVLILTAIATVFASGGRAAEWPRVAGQGTDWVRSLEEPRWPSLGAAGEPRWPDVTNAVERRFPSPWAFEIGARYWYSNGSTKFGFTNGVYPYGSPTSTLDWDNTQGHAGEIVARIDHKPSNLFLKGVAGAGLLRGGEMIDRDYTLYQYTFSDTTSQISGNNLRYLTVDFGYSYELPRYGVRFGGFVGYHYWHEKTTAYGLVCNPDDFQQRVSHCSPGSLEVPYSTAVATYEPTWHALRLGGDARIRISPRWTVSGEAALIPIAWLDNKDSHLLRQDPSDLGPAPNVLSKGIGYGGMAEVFVNYEVTPHIEAGLGVRYWGINAYRGNVNFGTSFNQNLQLDYFDVSRYGLLAQIKGRF